MSQNKNQYLVLALFCLGTILFEVIVFTSLLTHPYMVFLLMALGGVAIFCLVNYFDLIPPSTPKVNPTKVTPTLTGYLVLFNQPCFDGQIFTREGYDYTLLEKMKEEGRIDYLVDEKGIQVSFKL